MSVVDENLKAVREIIDRFLPGTMAIYQFGSAGSEYERDESDIDLAFLKLSKTATEKIWDAKNELALLLGREIDLIELFSASAVMRFEITNTGKRVFASDENACEAFESLALSMYVRLEEERKGILDDIKARGQIL